MVWNSLPEFLKKCHSITDFKDMYKRFYFKWVNFYDFLYCIHLLYSTINLLLYSFVYFIIIVTQRLVEEQYATERVTLYKDILINKNKKDSGVQIIQQFLVMG